MTPLAWLLVGSGAFSIGLGLWHVGVPRRFDMRSAIGVDGEDVTPLRPIRVGPLVHATSRADVLGIVGVMNAAASFVLVTIGIVGLAAPAWLGTEPGRWLAVWIAGWWALRAAMQLPIGRRRVDLAAMVVFGALALVYVASAVA
jgi:hypothetical protein